MRIGYCRNSDKSTVKKAKALQNKEALLKENGCDLIYFEDWVDKINEDNDRPTLNVIFKLVKEGDVLLVSELYDVCRSVEDLIQIIETLNERGATFASIDGTTITEHSVATLMAVSKLDKTIMRQRVKLGVKLAQESGRYQGRVPTYTMDNENLLDAICDYNNGFRMTEISRKRGIPRSSLYRAKDKFPSRFIKKAKK
jgi:DNA invertase Pin-like site-specific DNA recombinase